MRFISSLAPAFGALVLFAIALPAEAVVTCGLYAGGGRNLEATMAVQISKLTVPRDLPVGTRIYMQEFHQGNGGFRYQCGVTNAPVQYMYNVLTTKNNTGFSDSRASAYANVIYETGVKGIGFSWFAGLGIGNPTLENPKNVDVDVGPVGKTVVYSKPRANGCTSSEDSPPGGSCRTLVLNFTNTATLVLIKTGPVEAGTIDASQLGTLVQSARFGDSTAYLVATIQLVGSISVVPQTCKTPSVDVPMGSHKVSSFSGIGTATPPKKFAIVLTDCPGFPGYFGNPNAIPASSEMSSDSSDKKITSAGIAKGNTVTIQVDPVTTPIDAANGVLSLTTGADPATGAQMATGVGVQLLDSFGAPRALSTPQPLGVSLDANTTSIVINLGARYLQTAEKVTAGKANVVATYTIIYQ